MSLLRARKARPGWIDPRRGAPAGPTGAGSDPVGGGWATAGPVGGDSRLQAALSRGLAVALWLTIGLALLLGLLNLARGGAAPPVPAAAPVPAPPAPPPSGCAELLVAGWLAGDTRLVTTMGAVPGGASGRGSGGAPGVEREAVRTYTAAAVPAADERAWGYLVAAEVRGRSAGTEAWQDLGVQFFQVTMRESEAAPGCHGWIPAALPMQVPAPPAAAAASLPYPVPLATSDTDLSRTLGAFFAGLLAGTGDMERYLAPGFAVSPLVPPPYGAASLVELRGWAGSTSAGQVPPDGTVVRVLATVAVDQAPLPLVYPVTVAVRGGRWEVLAIDPFVGTFSGPLGANPTPGPAAQSPAQPASARPPTPS